MQVALAPWLFFSNSISALCCCPRAPLGKHPGAAPASALHPFGATQPPCRPPSSAGTEDKCCKPTAGARCLCQPKPEPRLGMKRAIQSVRGSNHRPQTFARHRKVELVPLRNSCGVAVPGEQLCWGSGHQKSLPLQKLGRGEACPHRQLMAWPRMFNEWEQSRLSGLTPPGSLRSTKQTGLLFDLF